MDKIEELREKAKQRLKVADHILTMTYPLVKDTKLLMVVTENLFLALTNIMSALLYFERKFKRIPPFSDNFEAKFKVFNDNLVPKYNIDKKYLLLMRELKEIILEHKRSPVEFVRKDRFVICSEDYRMKTITVDLLKKYIKESKEFITRIDRILSRAELFFENARIS